MSADGAGEGGGDIGTAFILARRRPTTAREIAASQRMGTAEPPIRTRTGPVARHVIGRAARLKQLDARITRIGERLPSPVVSTRDCGCA